MGSAPPSPGSEGGAYGKGSVHLPRGCREIPPIQNPPPALHSSLPGGAQHQVQPVCTSCAQGQILHTQPGLEGIRQGRRGQGQGKEGSQPPPRGWSGGPQPTSTHHVTGSPGDTVGRGKHTNRAVGAAGHRQLPNTGPCPGTPVPHSPPTSTAPVPTASRVRQPAQPRAPQPLRMSPQVTPRQIVLEQ